MKKWPHCGQCSNEMSLDKMASEYNPEAGLDDHDEMAGIAEESIEELIAMMDGSVPEDFPSKDGMSIEIMAMKPKKDEDDELF